MVEVVNVLEVGKHGCPVFVYQKWTFGMREGGENPSFEEGVPPSWVHELFIHLFLCSRVMGSGS